MFNLQKRKLEKQKGAAALLTVLIIGASSLVMAYTASQLGWGELEMGYDNYRGKQTLSLAEGCANEALQRLKFDPSYGGDNLSLGSGSCIITVTESGNDRSIAVTATAFDYTRELDINITLDNGDIIINSWQEN